jgi:surfactin synthase thioesterase subunit
MTRYAAMKLQLWPNMEALTPAPQPIGGCGRSTGALLVYDTLEDLRADHGNDCNYIMITERTPHEETHIQT